MELRRQAEWMTEEMSSMVIGTTGTRGHGRVGFGAGEEPGLGVLDLPLRPQVDP
jgi:hypothetical protein